MQEHREHDSDNKASGRNAKKEIPEAKKSRTRMLLFLYLVLASIDLIPFWFSIHILFYIARRNLSRNFGFSHHYLAPRCKSHLGSSYEQVPRPSIENKRQTPPTGSVRVNSKQFVWSTRAREVQRAHNVERPLSLNPIYRTQRADYIATRTGLA